MNSIRLKRLREVMKINNLDAMFISFSSNLRYISGYSGSNGICYITLDDAWFFTDFRYKTQSAAEVNNMNIEVPVGKDLTQAMKEKGCVKSGAVIGFEGDHLSFEQYDKIRSLFPDNKFINKALLMEEIASVKEEVEIEYFREAARITDAAFKELIKEIKPGISEKMLDAKLSYIMKSLGADKDSFDTIIASGVNGSRPHHSPTEKPLEKGELVTIDFGAMYKGYHGDVTRTVCLGKADAKQREIYDIVLQAQLKALDGIRPGVTGKAVDAIARDYISSKGYGDYFGHGLGHGLSLEIHAEPRLSPTYEKELLLNQVVTVEPGIYIPGWSGVRIEDDVIITKTGHENLTKATKELLEL
ncbi:MAG: Xaa-Pro peptidase family protein [Candidatus Marinimicrobia bacterium]|nr:Xaa-Pro peptidase family protein [Candidatus Neomarinimicrobiota bacterium]